jgi:hypothetical protein
MHSFSIRVLGNASYRNTDGDGAGLEPTDAAVSPRGFY